MSRAIRQYQQIMLRAFLRLLVVTCFALFLSVLTTRFALAGGGIELVLLVPVALALWWGVLYSFRRLREASSARRRYGSGPG